MLAFWTFRGIIGRTKCETYRTVTNITSYLTNRLRSAKIRLMRSAAAGAQKYMATRILGAIAAIQLAAALLRRAVAHNIE
jgi:hypothetical protein